MGRQTTIRDPDCLNLTSPQMTKYSSHASEENLVFQHPTVSMFSALSHQAVRTCKSIARSPSVSSTRSNDSHKRNRKTREKATEVSKMRIVTPVYDHDLERWIWPDSIFADDLEYERRHYRERRSIDSCGEGRERSSTIGSGSETLSLGSTSSRGSMDSRMLRY